MLVHCVSGAILQLIQFNTPGHISPSGSPSDEPNSTLQTGRSRIFSIVIPASYIPSPSRLPPVSISTSTSSMADIGN